MRKLTEEKLKSERERLQIMRQYEREAFSKGFSLVFGIDEAGRGPLCGPVCAACVILDPEKEILFLNDSKKLSEARREELFSEITEKALSFGVGFSDEKRIDEINILNATFEAMKDAYDACLKKLSGKGVPVDGKRIVFVDGNRTVPGIHDMQECLVKGDARSISVAAASILAKVSRDRLLYRYEEEYPGYGFAKHKGYGTKEHIEAIRRLGPCPVHRMSFLKGILQ